MNDENRGVSGGKAVASGSLHQARVLAFVSSHMLAGSQLGWLEPEDDTPVAVAAETGGPGDDIGVELKTKKVMEVQAKHGLTLSKLLSEAPEIAARGSKRGGRPSVVISVDRGSSATIHRGIRSDLHRLRAGDGPRQEATARLLDALGSSELARRLYIVTTDLDDAAQLETKLAVEQLSRVLKDPSRAREAWLILTERAIVLASEQGRFDRRAVVGLLRGVAGIEVEPIGPAADHHRRLDHNRRLLGRRYADAVLDDLRDLEKNLPKDVDPRVTYRLHVQRAAAYLFKGLADRALDAAERALESDPTGVHALAQVTHASLALDRVESAAVAADHAIGLYPDDPRAWLAKAAASVRANGELPRPPALVARTAEYRAGTCEIRQAAGDLEYVLAITAELLAEEHRDPEVLLMRAQALANTAAEHPDDADDRRRTAERLASELIVDVADDANPMTLRALIVRAAARLGLGKNTDCDEDLERSRDLKGDDPDVLRLTALRLMTKGYLEKALATLDHPAALENPVLLAVRADILGRLGRGDEAMGTVRRAAEINQARGNDPEVSVRLALSAVDAGDVPLARELAQPIAPDSFRSELLEVVWARVAVAERRPSDAVLHLGRAIERRPGARVAVTTLIAAEMADAGDAREAVSLYEGLGDQLAVDALQPYAKALLKTGDVRRAQQVIDRAISVDANALWAVALAGMIAYQRDDYDGAARHWTRLDANDALTPDGRARLALSLLRLERRDEARTHIDRLTSDPNLNAIQTMETAELLLMSGRASEAVPLAFLAARHAPDDARIQRAFASHVFEARVPPPQIDEVGPDTHVVMKDDDGKTRALTIYAGPPVDRRLDEVTVDDPRARPLVGKKVGDHVEDHSGTWAARRWTIVEILPALTYAVRRVMQRYNEIFPDEPPWFREYTVGTGELSMKDLLPFLENLEGRRSRIERTFDYYGKNPLPLGSIVEWLGRSVPQLMAALRASDTARLLVEPADAVAQSTAAERTAGAAALILTRSALVTAQELGLLDDLAATFKLRAPMSLRVEIASELRTAEEEYERGTTTMLPGPTVIALDPGAPELAERRDAMRGLRDWFDTHVEKRPLPLSWSSAETDPDRDVRGQIGSPSFDALALASEGEGLLYADDLGLRRLALRDAGPPPSVSTLSLVEGLSRRGALSAERLADLRLALVVRRYGFVLPTVDLLAPALRGASVPASQVPFVLELLIGPGIDLREAATVAAEVVAAVAKAPIFTVAPASVARRLVETLARRWGALAATRALLREVGPLLAWHEDDRKEIETMCREKIQETVLIKPG